MAAAAAAAVATTSGTVSIPKSRRAPASEEEERRCEEVAQLLLEGRRGSALTDAVKRLDEIRTATSSNLDQSSVSSLALPVVPDIPSLLQPQTQTETQSRTRRPSSVPLPNDYHNYQYNTMPAEVNFNPVFTALTPSTATNPNYPLTAHPQSQFQPFWSTQPLRNSQVNSQLFFGLPGRRASSAQPDLARGNFPFVSAAGSVSATLDAVSTVAGTESPEVLFNSWSFPTSESNTASESNIGPVDPLWVDTNVNPSSVGSSESLSSLSTRTSSAASSQSHPSSSSPLSINVGLANTCTDNGSLPQEGLYAPKPQSATQALFPDLDLGAYALTGFEQQPQYVNGMVDYGQQAWMGMYEGFGNVTQEPTAFDTAMDISAYGFGMDSFGGMNMSLGTNSSFGNAPIEMEVLPAGYETVANSAIY